MYIFLHYIKEVYKNATEAPIKVYTLSDKELMNYLTNFKRR